MGWGVAMAAACALALPVAGADWLPLSCKAHHTVGMHDHPGEPETYEASIFFESEFGLRENAFLMHHLADDESAVDLYMTMIAADGEETEFECRSVRGARNSAGVSCVNNPPSEILMLNPARRRFTRSAVGGWTFYAAQGEGRAASLFVEYGACVPAAREEDGAEELGAGGSGARRSGERR